MEQDDKLGEMGGHNNNLTPGGATGVNPEDLKALEEFELIDDNLNDLNSALDQIEQQNDNLKKQLMELLMSNREILQELKTENQNKSDQGTSSETGSSSSSMDQS